MPATTTNGKATESEKVPRLPKRIELNALSALRSISRTVQGILDNPDVAYRYDRQLQKRMRQDPDVFGPLNQRTSAIALLDWNIVPEDEDDKEQVAQAEILTDLVKRMRHLTEFINHQAQACWYGRAMSSIDYRRVLVGGKMYIAPLSWEPFHSDTLAYKTDGTLGMYINQQYASQHNIPIVSGFRGYVHVFTPTERKALVHHVWNREGPDFEEWREGAYQFGGRGLRDMVYFFWIIKQETLQNAVTWLERYSMGIREWRYPAGDDAALTAMETMAANTLGDVTLLIPRLPEDPDQFELKIHDPGGGAKSQMPHLQLIDGYLGGRIKELIVGQSATTEATSTGLGSSVGDQHAETFNRIIERDARALGDTFTHDLLMPMSRMNFGETPWYPRFEFSVNKADPEKFANAVGTLVDLDLEIPKKDARDILGFREPDEGEPVLSRADPLEGFGGGSLSDDFNRTRAALK